LEFFYKGWIIRERLVVKIRRFLKKWWIRRLERRIIEDQRRVGELEIELFIAYKWIIGNNRDWKRGVWWGEMLVVEFDREVIEEVEKEKGKFW
jgi:hypothetical protein